MVQLLPLPGSPSNDSLPTQHGLYQLHFIEKVFLFSIMSGSTLQRAMSPACFNAIHMRALRSRLPWKAATTGHPIHELEHVSAYSNCSG